MTRGSINWNHGYDYEVSLAFDLHLCSVCDSSVEDMIGFKFPITKRLSMMDTI